MWIVMRAARDAETGELVSRPRFHLPADATQQQAEALAQRLNRASSVSYMTAQYPNARRGPDHTVWMAAALRVLQAIDSDAPPEAQYEVREAVPFTGLSESVIPEFTALLTAFAQSSDPPDDAFEAIFRLIRDAPPV
jgi:hypothetical protein